jgi:hypothetical protein
MHAMVQAVSCRRFTWEAGVCVQVNLIGICAGQSSTGTGFSPISLVFPLSVSFHHCSILTYHRPMRCAIALTKQHFTIPSVLS